MDTLGPPKSRTSLLMVYLRGNLGRYRRFWILFGVVLWLDQVSKLVVLHTVPRTLPGGFNRIEVIPNFLHISHVYNKGAAFSILSGYGVVLILLAIVTLVLLFRFRRHLELRRPLMQWIFGTVAGGISGNVVDRVRLGHVVDFIDVNLPLFGLWPSFNVADTAICAGVGLYVLREWALFRSRDSQTGEAGAASTAGGTPADGEGKR